MRQRWLPRLGITSVAVGIAALGIATPAWANTATTPDLHQTNVTLADSEFDQGFGECTEVPDQSPTEDVWVFVWPGTENGDHLVKLELKFDSDGDGVADETVTEADATETTDSGTLKAVVTTPAGWTLLSGTSTITGDGVSLEIKDTFYFNLTHGCAGGGSETPTTPPTSPTSPSESTPGETSSAPGGGGGGTLPLTGTAVGGIVVVGVGLVAAGVALMAVRRRREIDLTDV
jgi:LPXTG-motif cell wall-anchored protein